MTDRWTDRLSEYLDGELSADERESLEAHLHACPDCEATLADLRRVVARAAALEDRPPAAELWSGIADRIGAGAIGARVARLRPLGAGRKFSLTLTQLAAASIALVTLSAGAMWMAMSDGAPEDSPPIAAEGSPADFAPDPSGAVAGRPVANFAERKYGAAISDLERVLAEQRDRLDPETVRAIEANLQSIDRAIEQARRALTDDPASDYLNSYLAGAMRQKLELLRRATYMTGASS